MRRINSPQIIARVSSSFVDVALILNCCSNFWRYSALSSSVGTPVANSGMTNNASKRAETKSDILFVISVILTVHFVLHQLLAVAF